MSTGINDPNRCPYCGNFHQFKCPLVKSFEYENGMVKRVEFFGPNDSAPKLAAPGQDPIWPGKMHGY